MNSTDYFLAAEVPITELLTTQHGQNVSEIGKKHSFFYCFLKKNVINVVAKIINI